MLAADVGIGPRFSAGTRDFETREIVGPARVVALRALDVEPRMTETDERAVAVGREGDLDRGRTGRDRCVPFPAPAEDHALGRHDLDVGAHGDVAVRDVDAEL